MARSIDHRLNAIETQLQSAGMREVHGIPAATWREIIAHARENAAGVVLERNLVMLESMPAHQTECRTHAGVTLRRSDLPRLRAELDDNWRTWFTARFGPDVAAMFLQDAEPQHSQ
jgi:hypothetical protein